MAPINCVSCQNPVSDTSKCGKCSGYVHAKEPCSKSQASYDAEIICSLCDIAAGIQQQRAAAKRKMEDQAEVMKKRSDQKFQPATIGQNVVIRIPDVDRGRADLRNIMAVVIEEKDGFYTLGTKYGRLNRLYVRNQFEICASIFVTVEEVPEKEISLREAVGHTSVSGRTQGVLKCGCTTKCTTNSCKCRKSKIFCNSRCHNSLSCCNK